MINNFFPPNQSNLRLKKLRGKSRYFKSVVTTAQEFEPSLGSTDWYDMWHYHADWSGYGNLNWKYRVKHIKALCIVYRKIVAGLKQYNKPLQLFIYLNQDDAGQDGVYIHTPNPNHDNFPTKFTETHWGIPALENYFSQMLSPYKMRAGRAEWQGSNIFYIYSPEIGEPFE